MHFSLRCLRGTRICPQVSRDMKSRKLPTALLWNVQKSPNLVIFVSVTSQHISNARRLEFSSAESLKRSLKNSSGHELTLQFESLGLSKLTRSRRPLVRRETPHCTVGGSTVLWGTGVAWPARQHNTLRRPAPCPRSPRQENMARLFDRSAVVQM